LVYTLDGKIITTGEDSIRPEAQPPHQRFNDRLAHATSFAKEKLD
jgi:hypothetical protein